MKTDVKAGTETKMELKTERNAIGSGKGSTESTTRKMKRLYQKAIRDLYAEGSIVLWEGPRRRVCGLKSANTDENENDDDTSYLWKSRTMNSSTTISISTLHSNHTNRIPNSTSTASSSSDSLSSPDPSDREEAYLPVHPHTVRTLVLHALTALTERTFASGTRRRRAPPTTEAILGYIRDTDERWAKVGRWRVEEALNELEGQERVFRAGEERWAVCV